MIPKLHQLQPRQFAEELGLVVSHSRPIDSEIHLKGREAHLKTVVQSIYAQGRHVFIYGERGVGKTSLAKTAGKNTATDGSCFKQIGCSHDATFHDLLRLIIGVFRPEVLASTTKQSKWGIPLPFFSYSQEKQEEYPLPVMISVSSAADILASLDDDGTKSLRVVVIDEVDRLESDDIRRQFAELLKLLGDRAARLTFIFTGVGQDLEQILGSHASSFRQLTQVPLERLKYQGALDIIDDALEKFGINWEIEPARSARFRIASIANGFPYYVHLLVEKLLYEIYEDKSAIGITLEHLQHAIAAAVKDAQEEIRKPYDEATRGRNDYYKLATWASADSWDLERTSSNIYTSYLGICARRGTSPINNKKFLQILAALKRKGYGPILKAGFRKGLYQFSENITRGYVRLCAAAEGVELNDIRPEDSTPLTSVHVPNKRYIDPRRLGGPPR